MAHESYGKLLEIASLNTNRPYVVTGANGRTGTAAAQALLGRGEPVRVVLRDPSQSETWIGRGATVAIADLTDRDAMIAAFGRARAVYIVSPQEYGRPDLFERAASIADVTATAAAQARVPKIVALSSVGADRDHGTGWIMMNRMLEHRLRPLDVPKAFIRAAYFMENWTSLIAIALKTGTLPSFLSPDDHAFPMVAAADVGVVAASILLEDWVGERIVDLAAPKRYAPNDVARCLGETTGKPVGVRTIPEGDWPSALATAGFSDTALRGFIEMTRSLNSEYIRFSDDGDSHAHAATTDLLKAVSAMAAQLGATASPPRRSFADVAQTASVNVRSGISKFANQ